MKLSISTDGTVGLLNAFVTLKCPTSQHESPHVQRRLLAYWPGHYKANYHVLVQCGTCKLEHVWHTNEVPAGLRPFHVRVHAAAGPHPLGEGVLPELEEEFQVLATDRQAAYRQSQFSMTMPMAGQTVTTYVDGEEERDERF